MIGTWYIIPMVLSPLVGVVGVIFGGWMTYRSNKRTSAGTVETSNASELWTENNRIIDRLQKDIERLQKDVEYPRNEIVSVRQERDKVVRENNELRSKVHDLELEMVRIRAGQPGRLMHASPLTVHPAADVEAASG